MRILVAVADPNRRALIETASRELGHECRSVADAGAGWEAFQDDDPDVVISEWSLPGLAGRPLHDLVRSHPRDRYAYVVLVPALEGSPGIVEGITAGADDYLVSPFSSDDLRVCLIAAERVTALHDKLARQQLQLDQLQAPLTGASLDGRSRLRNQRALDDTLDVLDARVTRYQHRYCLALVHVDHFAAYSATHSPLETDRALEAIARELSGRARSGDTVFRYAAGEFLHVLPEQTVATARRAAERLMDGVRALAIPDAENRLGVITVSIGLAPLDPDRIDLVQDVRRHAERALDEAISLGRNRVAGPTIAPASTATATTSSTATATTSSTATATT